MQQPREKGCDILIITRALSGEENSERSNALHSGARWGCPLIRKILFCNRQRRLRCARFRFCEQVKASRAFSSKQNLRASFLLSLFQPAEGDKFAVLVAVDQADHVIQLVVAPDAVAPGGIFRIDQLFHLDDERILFIDLMLIGQIIIVVDPVGDAREPARIVDGYARGAVQDLFGIENVVDFGVFEHAVRVNTRARRTALRAE